MNVGDRVRRIYEKRPYPRVGGENPLRARWRLAPLDWIRAVWQPAPGLPRRILVAGCGTGAEAFSLARRFPDTDIVGLDFSPQMLEVARRDRPGIEFLEGDALKLPFEDASFDASTIAFGLRNLADPVGGLRAATMRIRFDLYKSGGIDDNSLRLVRPTDPC